MIGASKSLSTISLSTSTSNYRGFVVKNGDIIYSATYTGTAVYATPSVKKYNATTGAYLGVASIGTCSGYSQPLYTTYDATSDGEGKIWTVSYNYRLLIEWTVSETGSWTCNNTYLYSYYPVGVDIDEDSGRMFLLMYQASSPNYFRYLYEINPNSPSQAIKTHLLGTRVAMGSSSTMPSGLYVDLPRVVTNEYQSSEGYHNYFTESGTNFVKQGKNQIKGGGHYGMDGMEDNTFGFQCHYYSQCSSAQRNVIQREGSGVIYDERTISSSSSVVTSSTVSISKSISEITVSAVVGYVPDNTSIEIEVSVDGGLTWLSGSFGQVLNFATAGNSIKWKAYLNGALSETPALDFVSLTYVSTYQSSGYLRLYKSYGTTGNPPVAATVFWNATTPSGTTLRVEIQTNTVTKQFQYSGQSQTIPSGTSYVYAYVRFTSNGQQTPILEDLNISLQSDVPNQVGINIGVEGMTGYTAGKEWTSPGTLLWDRNSAGFEIR